MMAQQSFEYEPKLHFGNRSNNCNMYNKQILLWKSNSREALLQGLDC